MMRMGLTAALFVTVFASAAGAEDANLNNQQKLGRALFEQHCGVCHTRPGLTVRMYGPELSRESGGGREDVVRGVIADGTPRMPGFKYLFTPAQIAAIAAYIKTMPPGTQAMIVPPAKPAK